jgi:hypothetical protein
MGRGKDDESNGRRKERKVRKEVQSARRRQRKEASVSLEELVEDLCTGPVGIALLCLLIGMWWSYWLSPYLWPTTGETPRQSAARTRETVQFQRMVQNCLDPHNDLVQEEVDYEIRATGGTPKSRDRDSVGNIAVVADGLCDMEQLTVLLETGRVDVNDRHYPPTHHFGYTLLHLAAGSDAAQAPSVMGMLINAGADLDTRATKLDRRTALYLATLYNNIEQIQMLLEAGANINRGDNLKTTPVYIAVQVSSCSCSTALRHVMFRSQRLPSWVCAPRSSETERGCCCCFAASLPPVLCSERSSRAGKSAARVWR